MYRGRRGETRRWRQWTEAEARAALNELAASKESVAEFARRKGVSTQRVAYWRKRLPATEPAFISVAIPDSAALSATIELAARGVTLRVREDVGIARLAAIVDVLIRAASGGPC
jgi:hypothetical protein